MPDYCCKPENQIEPEAATVLPMGSTGDPPVPTGDPPVGTGGRVPTSPDGWFYVQSPLHSVGPVAQRDRQVARATQYHFGIRASFGFQNSDFEFQAPGPEKQSFTILPPHSTPH
jgi:hypothetical protein